MLIDLTAPQPLLSIGKNQKLLANVSLNPILADKLGKYTSIFFKDAQQASGLVNVTVTECQNVPLGDLIKRQNNGRAKVDVRVSELRIDGPAVRIITQLAQMGSQGIVGEIRESDLVYQGRGFTQSQVNIFLTRKGVQLPLRFAGRVALDDLSLHEAAISIPQQLFGSDEVARIFPNGIQLPVTGTIDHFKIDTSNFVKQNAEGLIGGLINPKKKNDASSTQRGAQPGGPPDIGGLLQDVLGGNKKKDDQSQPANPPSKKKKK
jgi:hypothetical protein